MRVICRGYQTCGDRLDCPHSKPHEKDTCEDMCFTLGYKEQECDCISVNFFRKMKLEKLKHGEVSHL